MADSNSDLPRFTDWALKIGWQPVLGPLTSGASPYPGLVAFLDYYLILRADRALSSVEISEPLRLEDLMALTGFVQAAMLHDVILFAPNHALFVERDPGVSNLMQDEYRNLPFKVESFSFMEWDMGSMPPGGPGVQILRDELKEHLGLDDFGFEMLNYAAYLVGRAEQNEASVYAQSPVFQSVDLWTRIFSRKRHRSVATKILEQLRSLGSEEESQWLGYDFVERYLHPPLFLDFIVGQCADRRPECIHKMISELQASGAAAFRRFVRNARNDSHRGPMAASKVVASIEEELRSIVSGKSPAQAIMESVLGMGGSIIKKGPLSLLGGILELPKVWSRYEIYRDFRVLRRTYAESLQTGRYYQELKRVFGSLEFTESELERAYTK